MIDVCTDTATIIKRCRPGMKVDILTKNDRRFKGVILDISDKCRFIQLDCANLMFDDIEAVAILDNTKNYESTDKMVSHPDHYQSTNGLEVIDAIEAFTDGLNGIEATDTGNIIKYACRWHKKNGIQDLEKILWYTQHLINHLKEKESNIS